LTSIEDEVFIISADRMVSILYTDNAKVLGSLTIARNAAENAKAYGLVNFLEERLDQHNKHAWMLRASMK
jgi:DNA-binding ferritin-like protein